MDTTLLLPTRSGIDVLVRPATEADEAALVDFFDRVSDEDRRFRFFRPAPTSTTASSNR